MDDIIVQESVVCQHCGLVDDYTATMKSNQKVATCNGCGKFIKNIPYRPPQFYFGKYKGKLISECDDLNYLLWVIGNVRVTGHFKTAIESQIFKLSENG